MAYLATIRKALVPIVITLVIAALSAIGITEQMSVAEAVPKIIEAIALGFVVWLVPNAKA